MKKLLILLLVLSLSLGVAACSKSDTATADEQETQAAAEQATERATQAPTQAQTDAPEATDAPAQTDAPEPTVKKPAIDPHTTANEYDLSSAWFERQSGTDYGTLLTDVTYFSTTADDDKRVNILLPPGYDENGAYPVLYMIHGWGGDYTGHLHEDSYLHMLYGNL